MPTRDPHFSVRLPHRGQSVLSVSPLSLGRRFGVVRGPDYTVGVDECRVPRFVPSVVQSLRSHTVGEGVPGVVWYLTYRHPTHCREQVSSPTGDTHLYVTGLLTTLGSSRDRVPPRSGSDVRDGTRLRGVPRTNRRSFRRLVTYPSTESRVIPDLT